MDYKNSFRLLTYNFSLVWKQLLYWLIIFLVSMGLAWAFASPIISALGNDGVFKEISEAFQTVYSEPKEVLSKISSVSLHFARVIRDSLKTLLPSIFGFFFVLCFLYKFLKFISTYSLTKVLHMKMTTYVNIGYTRTLISTLSQSTLYSLARFLMDLPFMCIKVLIALIYFKLVKSFWGITIGLFAVVLLITIIQSFEMVLFSAMAVKMIEVDANSNPFKMFVLGFKTLLKRFDKIFSTAFITVLTILFINLFLGVFTVGVGLLISIPASFVFVRLFDLTSYFGTIGERYYMNDSLLYCSAPKK